MVLLLKYILYISKCERFSESFHEKSKIKLFYYLELVNIIEIDFNKHYKPYSVFFSYHVFCYVNLILR